MPDRNSSRLLPFALLFALFLWTPPTAGRAPSGAERIYHQAWSLLKDKFYDEHLNGQNWCAWEHRYDGKLATESECYRAIDTMIASLSDPYTKVLDPKSFKDEMGLIDSHIVGIGVTLEDTADGKHILVGDTVSGSPAAQAGICKGDELISINGKSVSGLALDEAGRAIGGKAGTVVALTFKRDGREILFNIKRQKLQLHSVTYKRLDSNIGYINISNFLFEDAARDFRAALNKLVSTDGLILDLRHNPGGLIENAIKIADMLLDKGPIVTTIDRQEKLTDVASGYPVTRQPVVLLVDRESASASEILAAALKQHGRAVIVGTRTYGKGLVQEINPLADGGALHITVARYVGPDGLEINKVGVAPHIVVDSEDAQMRTAIDLIKRRATAFQPAQLGTAPNRS